MLTTISLSVVHMRTKEMESDSPALWDKLTHLVQSVNVPVIANGDIYTHKDRERIRMETKCAGIMSSRGVLLNASLLISPERGGPHSLREVIRDFLIECVKYHPPYQVGSTSTSSL
jgi:tRNA-dihydrouridine synthase 4